MAGAHKTKKVHKVKHQRYHQNFSVCNFRNLEINFLHLSIQIYARKVTQAGRSIFTMKKFFFIFLIIPFFSIGQELSYLSYDINAVEQSVQLIWVVSAGNSCQNVELQHSTDGINFVTFFTYAGVCGDPNLTLSYDHTHQTPVVNQTNYYRLKINQDLTEIKSVFISRADEILVIPHPVKETSEIIFSQNNGIVEITVYNLSGGIMWRESYANAPFYVNANNFKSGFYILEVKQEARIIRQKILVL